MFKAVLAFALLAVAIAMPSDQFEIFERTFNKQYATAEERQYRMTVFTQTLKRIEQFNAIEGAEVHGINEFADLTQDEFRARFLMDAEKFAAARAEMTAPVMSLAHLPTALPTSFNWATNSSVVTPVKNQGQCGSCWAFSATENIESVWALAGNPIVQLAPQQIVDCDTQDSGCNGGWPRLAFEYVISAGGLELESSYPYTAEDGTCKAKKNLEVGKISSWNFITQNKNETEMQVALYNVAPLSICVDAITWQTYTKGVITSNCGTSLDHCVQLTGWNTEKGIDYWIVRNSWGTSWGNAGYIYVEIGKDLCGIATQVTTTVAA